MRNIFIAFMFLSLCFVPISSAQEEIDPFEEAGLSLVALRNDTLDVNQDGMMDSVRVVIILNSTQSWIDLTLSLFGDHNGLTVLEEKEMSFESQENTSLTYDSWAEGEHRLVLEISDVEGRLLKSISIGSFDLTPSLNEPEIDLVLSGSEVMMTGDECSIKREFVDETGPRWGKSGTRTITGTPFKVLDTDYSIDCSNWPAGEYTISETYSNGLGQTTSDVLIMVIANRPPPNFEITVTGTNSEVGTPCMISLEPRAGENHDDFLKEWTITPSPMPIGNVSTIDCSMWGSGVHKVLLKVTNFEEISTTQGAMLVRLPSTEIADIDAPVISEGEDTQTSNVGIYGIIILALFLGVLIFVVTMNNAPSDEIMSSMMQIEPDSEGLPTHLDDEGILWRRHEDGELDWWDESTYSWRRW